MLTQWPDPRSCEELTTHQQEIASAALSRRIGVLAGTPGTGKTFTAAAIIRRLISLHGAFAIAIAAPTGKAAVRCTSSLRANGVAGIEARTIHRLLGVCRNGHDGNGWGFLYDDKNPLPYRFIIIDETSMLDTDLFASLLRACGPQTHLLLIGDPYQLPPVGHGAPLRDMLASDRIARGELTEIKRNSGRIVQGCRLIKEGQRFDSPTTINLETGENWRHFETSSPAQTLAQLQFSLTSLPSRFNPVWDVQVLVAVNEKSPLCRKAVNVMLQDLLNPHGQRVEKVRFRVGDKVICTQNVFLPLADEDRRATTANSTPFDEVDAKSPPQGKEFVANGELARVLAVDPKKMTVEFSSPKRVCVVPLMKSAPEANGTAGEESTGSIGGFDLGYAITTHKAQGSQAPIVIVLVDEYGGAMRVASREFNYTAISRAESLCLTIGKWSIFHQQCQRVALSIRKTFLKERLNDVIA